jgi:hypothetical protein
VLLRRWLNGVALAAPGVEYSTTNIYRLSIQVVMHRKLKYLSLALCAFSSAFCLRVRGQLVPPTLIITQSGTNVSLAWPTNFPGFGLQSTTNLAPPFTWSALSGQYAVTIPSTNKQEFFRLTNSQFGSHIVTWIHDGFTSPGPDQQDIGYSNSVSMSYGAIDDSGAMTPLLPVTNTASLSDPLSDFTCSYVGTNISFITTVNMVSSNTFYYYQVDGQDDGNYPWIIDGGSGAGRLQVSFEKALQHTIRIRGKGFTLNRVRIQQGDSVFPTVESSHRVNIIGFGDSHTDGGSSGVGFDPVTQMQTWVNRIHHYIESDFSSGTRRINVFGSAIGGTGVIATGVYGVGGTYTNRIFEDIWGQHLNPDIFIYEGSNDGAIVTFGGTVGTNTFTSAQCTNLYAVGIRNISFTISTNMPGSNVWLICGPFPCATNQMDAGIIWIRDNMKTNCAQFGFHFIDFTGGATNQNDFDRGYITDANLSRMWGPGGHLTPYGKEWFAGLLATNIATNVLSINK